MVQIFSSDHAPHLLLLHMLLLIDYIKYGLSFKMMPNTRNILILQKYNRSKSICIKYAGDLWAYSHKVWSQIPISLDARRKQKQNDTECAKYYMWLWLKDHISVSTWFIVAISIVNFNHGIKVSTQFVYHVIYIHEYNTW